MQVVDMYQVLKIGSQGATGLPALALRQSTAVQQCRTSRFTTFGHAGPQRGCSPAVKSPDFDMSVASGWRGCAGV
jgi:hypothetical protein